MNIADQISTIDEVLKEISRVNEAAGYTVFNPAAREALIAMKRELNDQPLRFKMVRTIDGGTTLARQI